MIPAKLSASELTQFISFIVAILIISFIYSFGLNGPLLLDDISNLTPIVNINGDYDQAIKVVKLNSSGITPFSRALPTLSFVITSLLHGDNFWAFKFHNLLTHFACALLILLLIRKLLVEFGSLTELKSTWCAISVSFIWLIHPLHVSTVLYSVQRITQVSALFVLLTLCIYLYARFSRSNSTKATLYFIAFPIGALLGLMSKENAALIFVYILLINFLILGQRRSIKTGKLDKVFIWLFCYTPLLIGSIIFIVKADSFMSSYAVRTFTMEERLLNQIFFVAFYLKQLIFPQLSKMGLFFDDITIYRKLSSELIALLFMHVMLISVGLWALFRGKIWALFLLLFYTGHLVESTIIPLELAFEHRNYFPSIGIFAACAYLIIANLSNIKALALLSIISLFWGALLFLRVGYWSNEHEWEKTNLVYHPLSKRTHMSYLAYLAYHGLKDELIEHQTTAEKLFKDEPNFIMLRLSRECVLSNDATAGKESLETVEHLLLKHGFTIQRVTVFSNLILNQTRNKCSNMNYKDMIPIARNLIDKEIKSQRTINLPYLYSGLATLVLVDGNFIQAKDYFMNAYELSNEPLYLFSAVESLLQNKALTDKADALLKTSIANGDFDKELYIDRINVIKEIISNNQE